jgi:hypothetical protein
LNDTRNLRVENANAYFIINRKIKQITIFDNLFLWFEQLFGFLFF